MSAVLSVTGLDSFLGATFIGVVLSTVLFGITCMQLYLYYAERCLGDSRLLKFFVGGLVVIDTFHCAMVSVMFYHYTVSHFANLDTLSKTTWRVLRAAGGACTDQMSFRSFSGQATVGAVASLMVQCFFAHHIYHLSRKIIVVPVIIVLLSIVQLVIGGSTSTKRRLIIPLTPAHGPRPVDTEERKCRFNTPILPSSRVELLCAIVAIVLHVVCDVLITSAMAINARRGRLSFRSMSRVNLLVIYVMSTGLAATTCALVCAITLLAMPDTMVYTLFYFVTVRLYSCSLLTLEKEFDGEPADHLEEFDVGDRGLVGIAV
ncbi:hypothetical protein OF83DRAFT_1176314 [Amylostereum chailletii]|nr:hypothetical protein OF83DRAFT_1176314 [Amylostereum chailletii]